MTTILERPVGEPVAVPRLSALLVLLTGTFITTLDFFIVNVAIPSTQRAAFCAASAGIVQLLPRR